MKDICKIFLIFLFFTSCSKKSEKVETEKVLDTVVKIKVINFEKSKAVIFPANYWKQPKLAKYYTDYKYFTPDEKTIRNIEKQLPKTAPIIYAMWRGDSHINAKHMQLYDKQYYGYIDKKNDSIVAVRIFNFIDSYPEHVKNSFETEASLMVCGWYNFYTLDLSYSIKRKEFKNFN